MKIAILGGTGDQGPGLALRWARAGEEVMIGSRQQEKAERVARELNQELGRDLIRGLQNRDAAEEGQIVALTVPYSAHLSTLESVKDLLRGKIFIDVSVPLDPDNPRRMKYPPQGSATQEAQEVLGPETRVVGAFQNASSHGLRQFDHPIDCDVLVCGDDRDARQQVIALVEKMGLRAIDAGPAANAHVVEGLTSLLIGLNIRNKVKATGIRITGLP